MARKANPERAFRPWAISMCIAAMHWGNLFGMGGHLTIHTGKLLLSKDRFHERAFYELPEGLTIAYAIISVIGWLSILTMLIGFVYIREMCDAQNNRYMKYGGYAYLFALCAFVVGILVGRFFNAFDTLYTP